jgi:hypothetical protein
MSTQEPDDGSLRTQNDVPASRKPHESDDSTAKGSISLDSPVNRTDILKVQHFLQSSCALVPIVHHPQDGVELFSVVDGMIFEYAERV